MGLVLYLTDLWLMCLIVAGALTVLLVVGVAVFIRRRFFTKGEIAPEAEEDEIKELEQNWRARNNHNVQLVRIHE